jgi:TM2 domain-containing membrane protein YozV
VTYLRVNSNITTEEMARIISRLLNNTVLGLDRILNEALKTCGLLIVLWLANIVKIYFVIGYYLRLKRAITTFVLYKEGKVDYLFLGSYCFIALKNTLSKILERVVADYIADIAKEYALLL